MVNRGSIEGDQDNRNFPSTQNTQNLLWILFEKLRTRPNTFCKSFVFQMQKQILSDKLFKRSKAGTFNPWATWTPKNFSEHWSESKQKRTNQNKLVKKFRQKQLLWSVVGTGVHVPIPNFWDCYWDRFFKILGLGSIFQNFGIGINFRKSELGIRIAFSKIWNCDRFLKF